MYGHQNETTVPQPTGKYIVPSKRAYNGAPSTKKWRKELMKKAMERKKTLKDENASLEDIDALNEAKIQIARDAGMPWSDLWLDGWQPHHIHPRDWNGNDNADNFQYLKQTTNNIIPRTKREPALAPTNQHDPFTTWWDKKRKPNILKEVQ